MYNKNLLNRIIAFLAAVVMLVAVVPVSAFAAEKGEIVVVGANPDFGITKNGTKYSGIAYEFFEQMKKHTGHRYTYVEGTPDELIAMLKEKKIDVIPCVSKADVEVYFSGETENAVLSDYSIMKKFSAVYVPDSSSDIGFYDITALKNARIGCLADDVSKYFVDGSFVCAELVDAQFVVYNTEAQMKSDFFSGKLDAVVKDCFRPWANESIVYQFGMGDSFFLTDISDKELSAQLTEAAGGVTITDPYFSVDMYERFISCFGSQKFAFSDAEKEFITKNKYITVAYNLQSNMIETYDKGKKRLVGIMGDMIADLESKTGFSISVVTCSSIADCVKMLESGEADVICGGVNNYSISGQGSILVTTPVSRVPVVAAGRANTQISDHSKIAIPFYGSDIEEYLKLIYPNATFLPYDDVKKCMDAVLAGEADVLCAGAYEIIYLKNGSYDNFEIIQTFNCYHSECFGMSTTEKELASIFGKALAQMTSTENGILTFDTMTSFGYDSMTLSRFVDKYLFVVVIVIAIILAELAVLVVVLRRNSRRNSEIDPLTGGRTKQKYIEDSLKAVKKSSPEKWAIVLFDINKFKYVNDRLGYEEGNRMLERLYKTISDHLDDDEVFSRISDDNFALTVHNLSDNEMTSKINMIFDEFSRRNALFVKYPVLFSAGVCRLGQCVDKHGAVDINAALDRATIAKKTQKGQHNTSISFYDGKIREKALREKDYESAMPTALQQHEFECYLQPKYGLKSRHIEGAEALIRWNSKEFGFVFPNDFIPLSEKNGFVVDLDFYILEEVCKAMRRWLDDGKTPVVVSVNQSRLHLNNEDYIWRLREIVDKYEIPYEYIELEITESVFSDNVDRLLVIMKKLHEIGFKLSIDDFGSGYSSLNMLKDVPADVIKIDREFFNGTVNSEKGRAVIETVVGLAKKLHMEVISEGVETLDQINFLSEIDCHMVQGYYFAKPMPMSAYEDMWFNDLEMIKREEAEKASNAEKAAQTSEETAQS